MKVILKNHWVVKPAEPTWNGIVSLSEFDQTFNITHVPTIYYYKLSPNFITSIDHNNIINTLKTSLSKSLVHFYPLAGRLRWIHGSRLELDCDASGVVLTEAETDVNLDDDFVKSPYYKSLFPNVDYKIPISQLPLLFVQLTKFKCGAIALSFAISHAVVDGQSALYFFTEWARLSRGEPLMFPPFHDRKVLRAGEPSIALPTFEHLQFNPAPILIRESNNDQYNKKKHQTKEFLLKLTKKQVEYLRGKANQGRNLEDQRSYTRYEIITAHIWRCACKARGHKFEQPTNLFICVDIRQKMEPPLSKFYFGNAIVDVVVKGVSGDISSSPFESVARKVRTAIGMVTNDYANSTINFLKKQEDLSKYQDIHKIINKEVDHSHGNPNIGVVSWINLPLLGLDFGWGKEIYMSPGIHEDDGNCLILPPGNDGSLTVSIVLQDVHVDDFKKLFYQDIEC